MDTTEERHRQVSVVCRNCRSQWFWDLENGELVLDPEEIVCVECAGKWDTERQAAQEEIASLTARIAELEYMLDNNQRAWEEAQAEIASLNASRERLREYVKVVNPYSVDIVPQRANLAAVKAFLSLEDGDLADAATAPVVEDGKAGA